MEEKQSLKTCRIYYYICSINWGGSQTTGLFFIYVCYDISRLIKSIYHFCSQDNAIMTNNQLYRMLKNMDPSEGRSVRAVDDLEAVLMANHKTVSVTNHQKFTHYHDYLVLLKAGEKAGIILNCDSVDVHAYVLRKYRGQHIVSKLTNNGFLKNLWPDIDSVTCANPREYDKLKHLAEIAGFTLRFKRLLWCS